MGGLQYSNQLDCISPDVCSPSSFVEMMFFGVIVIEFLVYCRVVQVFIGVLYIVFFVFYHNGRSF